VYILDGILRLQHIPDQVRIIVILKPGEPRTELSSYWPISLLPVPIKIVEKLFLRRMELIVDKKLAIPDFRFGFRSAHSTINQVHRVTQITDNRV
jgi:hypothetical protein